VDTVLPDGSLLGARSDVLKGVPAGFEVRPANYEEWSDIALVTIPCTLAEQQRFEDFERAQLHKPYDGPGIVGFVLPFLDRTKDVNWRDPSKWFCSEEKQVALEACGWMPKIDFPDNKVTPVANYLMVLARGGTLV
jgi:hypothetical protein